MSNSYLIDIGLNDSTQDIVRKCNSNFRRLASDQRTLGRSDVRREGERTDAAINGAVTEINVALEQAINELNVAINEAEDRINITIKNAEDRLDDKIDEINKLLEELENKVNEDQEAQNDVVASIKNDVDNLRTNVKNIIYGATISGKTINIPSGTKVPTGNINVLSSTRATAILTHDGDANGDIRAN